MACPSVPGVVTAEENSGILQGGLSGREILLKVASRKGQAIVSENDLYHALGKSETTLGCHFGVPAIIATLLLYC